MQSVRYLVLGLLLVGVAACEDDPLDSKGPGEPPPPTTGVQAYLEVDRENARPGETVRVAVKVQVGTQSNAKVGSYTGRLVFDPKRLAYRDEVKINDGLRVANPNDAERGAIRFAGAAAKGFADLTLYAAVFEVKGTDYASTLSLEMQELSAALSLENLEPELKVAPRVFFQTSGN